MKRVKTKYNIQRWEIAQYSIEEYSVICSGECCLSDWNFLSLRSSYYIKHKILDRDLQGPAFVVLSTVCSTVLKNHFITVSKMSSYSCSDLLLTLL